MTAPCAFMRAVPVVVAGRLGSRPGIRLSGHSMHMPVLRAGQQLALLLLTLARCPALTLCTISPPLVAVAFTVNKNSTALARRISAALVETMRVRGCSAGRRASDATSLACSSYLLPIASMAAVQAALRMHLLGGHRAVPALLLPLPLHLSTPHHTLSKPLPTRTATGA